MGSSQGLALWLGRVTVFLLKWLTMSTTIYLCIGMDAKCYVVNNFTLLYSSKPHSKLQINYGVTGAGMELDSFEVGGLMAQPI